jgi:hypothetical protein
VTTAQAIYAPEIVALVKMLLLTSVLAAVSFAFLYGTVRPRMKLAFKAL